VLEGYPESSVVLAVADGVLVGHLFTPFGFFAIVPRPDGSYAVEQRDQTAGSTSNGSRTRPTASSTMSMRFVTSTRRTS
jgi:hypothetical protein